MRDGGGHLFVYTPSLVIKNHSVKKSILKKRTEGVETSASPTPYVEPLCGVLPVVVEVVGPMGADGHMMMEVTVRLSVNLV